MNVITGENIEKYRLLTLKAALKLETKGLRHSRMCASQIVRQTLQNAGIKAKRNKIELLVQFEQYLETI